MDVIPFFKATLRALQLFPHWSLTCASGSAPQAFPAVFPDVLRWIFFLSSCFFPSDAAHCDSPFMQKGGRTGWVELLSHMITSLSMSRCTSASIARTCMVDYMVTLLALYASNTTGLRHKELKCDITGDKAAGHMVTLVNTRVQIQTQHVACISIQTTALLTFSF